PLIGLFCPHALAAPTLPDVAAILLSTTRDGWLPPDSEAVKRCRALTTAASAFARQLAEHTHRACADRAAAIATLAPLGWLAVAAIDPGAAAEPLHDSDLSVPFHAIQSEVWGLDQDAIARRLAVRWRLPTWIGTALGNLSIPLVAARAVVADADLF